MTAGASGAAPAASSVSEGPGAAPSAVRPLEGVTVLDLTNVLAGPFAGYQLACLGARVIKVESPEGDLARRLGAEPGYAQAGMGVSFLAVNAGKESIALDLKHPAAAPVFMALVERADVLLENFRPGVMDRLGFGAARLTAHNPRLVYCGISGFGATGPLAQRPAYDQIIQGLAGVMSVTGDEASSPLRVGYPVCDTIGGLTAAFAVVAALLRARATGRGATLDVSMLDATIATMGWVVSNYLNTGVAPRPMGNDNFTAAPSGTFRTGDGLINIAANEDASSRRWRATPGPRSGWPIRASRAAKRANATAARSTLRWKRSSPRFRPPSGNDGSSRPACRWAGCCRCRRFSAATTRGRRSSSAAGTASPVRRGRWPWRGRAFALTASGRPRPHRRRPSRRSAMRCSRNWDSTPSRARRCSRRARLPATGTDRRRVRTGDHPGSAGPRAESGCTVPGGRCDRASSVPEFLYRYRGRAPRPLPDGDTAPDGNPPGRSPEDAGSARTGRIEHDDRPQRAASAPPPGRQQ